MNKSINSTFSIKFQRDKPTFEFLRSILNFVLLGKKTWDYKNSEADARIISLWISRQK